MLNVKKIFGPTIQGEGKQSGLPAIFIRFSGCNMWSGKMEDRESSGCPFCDTDFYKGIPMSPLDVLNECNRLRGESRLFLVVLTGGEPMLQNSEDMRTLLILLRTNQYISQMETNGTIWKPEVVHHLDFVTVSPKKPRAELKADFGQVDCLKLLYPHPTVEISDFRDMIDDLRFIKMDFCIQPIEEGGPERWKENTKDVVALVKSLGYPWRLSLQTHKMLGEE